MHQRGSHQRSRAFGSHLEGRLHSWGCDLCSWELVALSVQAVTSASLRAGSLCGSGRRAAVDESKAELEPGTICDHPNLNVTTTCRRSWCSSHGAARAPGPGCGDAEGGLMGAAGSVHLTATPMPRKCCHFPEPHTDPQNLKCWGLRHLCF